ncbi:MAG TPA: hypothetical protein VK911_01240 [Vicinamibacterales bacterium]|nr:hypothetical protein [Vicinamibacterales bacterium]
MGGGAGRAIRSGYVHLLLPDSEEIDETPAFDTLVAAVRAEDERDMVVAGDEAGPYFENHCQAEAGFLLGLELGRTLGGAR